MLIRFLLKIILVLVTVIFQTAIRPALGWPFDLINVVLLLLVFYYVLSDLRQTISLAVFVGCLLDLYHPIFFGLETLALVVTVFFLDFVYLKFFTNKSFYTLALLSLLGLLISEFLRRFLAEIYFIARGGLEAWQPFFINLTWVTLVQMLVINAVMAGVIFIIFYNVSHRFHSVIIKR
jgi:cell shape-determining protein MreD